MDNTNGSLYQSILDRAVKNERPIITLIELTYKCNVHCQHCYVVPCDRPELTAEQMKLALDQLADAGVFHLTLSGGEILCRPDFFEIASYARDKRFALRLFTNATLVTDDVAVRFKELAPVCIEVSLLGATAESHDAVTGTPGSFEKAIAGIERIKERDITLALKTCWMKNNFRQYRELLSLAEKYGAYFRGDSRMTPMNNGSCENLAGRMSDDELFDFFRATSEGQQPEQPGEAPTAEEIAARRPCGIGLLGGRIDPYGEVYPCIQVQVSGGNILDRDYYDIWKNEEIFRQARNLRLGDFEECLGCEKKQYCFNCPGIALMEKGKLHAASSDACRVAAIRQRVYQAAT